KSITAGWFKGGRSLAYCGGSKGVAPLCLILFGLAEVDVVLFKIVIASDGAQRIEAWCAVLERQAHLMQLELDLVDRLRAEIADVQQILLATRYQLRHGVNALALEAVVRPHGQVQVLDRQRKISSELLINRGRSDLDALSLHVQLASKAEQLNERTAGRCDCIAWPDGLLRLDVQDQLVEVGALLDAGGFDLIGDLEHR